METRAHYVLIGAFTLMVIVAAFALVWYVSGAGGVLPAASTRSYSGAR